MRTSSLFILLLTSLLIPVNAFSDSRPNILWITAEDMSPNLGCYGDTYATTPNLDQFSKESVRYTQAFATAPVCSPARSCLITGIYANSLGTENLRSVFPLPKNLKGVPAFLREQGYYTSNDVKTDYNCQQEHQLIQSSWDACKPKADWRGRKDGQPFFCVINLMTTHQSRTSVWPYEEFEKKIASQLPQDKRHDPAQAPVPPFYPDTPLVRRGLARYYDCISVMDQQVGSILKRLEADGLKENTIVFFYSDHGMGMPRGKRVLQDSGLKVPLMIRFPQKYSTWASKRPGETENRLVSFIDFPPTLLSLAGISIPDYMQGFPFLGKGSDRGRDYVFAARDRVDEVYDLARSVRSQNYLYIRNYMPHLPWGQRERYSDNSAVRRQILKLSTEDSLSPYQRAYAGTQRQIEELYDVTLDSHQVKNLVDSPKHQEVLKIFRKENREHLMRIHDLGFFPESQRWKLLERGPAVSTYELKSIDERLDLKSILKFFDQPDAEAGLKSSNPTIRFWSVIQLRIQKRDESELNEQLIQLLKDKSASVRIEAATALVENGRTENGLEVLLQELNSPHLHDRLRAARAIELLDEQARSTLPAIKEALNKTLPLLKHHPLYLFLQFSYESTIESLET